MRTEVDSSGLDAACEAEGAEDLDLLLLDVDHLDLVRLRREDVEEPVVMGK